LAAKLQLGEQPQDFYGFPPSRLGLKIGFPSGAWEPEVGRLFYTKKISSPNIYD
jgi:hypothetical protein